MEGRKWNYIGMVDKNNKPSGWGRAITVDNYRFQDGQWEDGFSHGYRRSMY
jgi:hypothetical protein